MNARIKLILLLFILVLIVIIIGNYIHNIFIKNNALEDNRDTYVEDGSNLSILIEVDRKRLSVIDMNNNVVIKTYAVATGKSDTPTPLGTFKIVEKAKWGGGFGSRWLGLNVPWGRYGIHGTNRPGSIGFNASAGCVRMRNKDVEELFDMVDYNTTVTIINGIYGPFGYGFRNLKPGDRGADVAEVQKRLKILGYYSGNVDGIYGEGMKQALIQFLNNNNIPLTDTIDSSIYEKLNIILMD
ncbi:MAG TPA: L,D-transpeptidase family protein [Tissierellia bacterium]|nr:L,D-transpeptidase family protein [Tissierellia bacterium]